MQAEMGSVPAMLVVRNLHERMARLADEATSALHEAEHDLPEQIEAGAGARRVFGGLGTASPAAEEAAAALGNAAGDLLEAASEALSSTRKRGDEIDAALARLREAFAQRRSRRASAR